MAAQLPTPDSSINGSPFSDLQPTARPFSAYQTPTTAPVADPLRTNSLTQLSRALGDLQPTLNSAVAYTVANDNQRLMGEAAVAASKAAQDRNIKDIKAAMEAEQIPPGASPIYLEAYKKTFLKLKGERAGAELQEAYHSPENEALRNSDDPDAFNKFASQWRHNYMSDILAPDGQAQFSGLDIAGSGFNETVQRHVMSLNSEHINHRVSEREKIGRETASNLAQARLDSHFNQPFYARDLARAGQDIQDVWYSQNSGMVAAGGLKGSNATHDMSEAIITSALQRGDDSLLDVADHIKTPGGTLAGTKIWREKAAIAREQIAGHVYQARVREDALAKLDAGGSLDERTARYVQQFKENDNQLYRDKAARDLSTKIYLAPAGTEAELQERSKMIAELTTIDPHAAVSVRATVQKFEEHSTETARTKAHDYGEGKIRQEILDNPTSPTIERRIVRAFQDDVIDRGQMTSMLGMVDHYRTNATTPHSLKDPIYEDLEKSVYRSSVGDISKIGGLEALEAGRAQYEFRLEAMKRIKENPSLANNAQALAEVMEKRVQPTVERHNSVILYKRQQDEADRRQEKETLERAEYLKSTEWDQQKVKIQQQEQAFKAFDAGKGPDPRLPKVQTFGAKNEERFQSWKKWFAGSKLSESDLRATFKEGRTPAR